MNGPALSNIDPVKMAGDANEAERHILDDVWATRGSAEYLRYRPQGQLLSMLDTEAFLAFWLLVAHSEGVL